MANHGFINLPKKTTLEELKKIADELLSERFEARFYTKIEHDTLYGDNIAVYIRAHPTGPKTPQFVHFFWLPNPESRSPKVEFRHGNPIWASWIEHYVWNGIAKRLGGQISDEGTGYERWEPNPDKYPSFKDYLLMGRKAPEGKRNFVKALKEKRDYENACERAQVIVGDIVQNYGDVFENGFTKH